MARILRAEFYWADLDPVQGHEQGGLRPILVLILMSVQDETNDGIVSLWHDHAESTNRQPCERENWFE
ncbi:MAG: type II toxin-antitoxin system PemK/MazF family toxin [Coriobacteriia bacterium]